MATDSDQQPLHRNDPTSDRPPKKKPCNGYCCYKCLVAVYSLIFLVVGVILFALGIWIATVKADIESINAALTAPVILAVILGVCMIIFAFIGLIGALREKILLLKIFLGIAIFIFLGQVVIGILAFIYREETMNVVEKQLTFAIQNHEHDEGVTRGVNHIQQRFKCCGLKGPSIWEKNEFYSCDHGEPPKACGVPDSCCRNLEEGCGYDIRLPESDKSKIFDTGCLSKFRVWIETNLDIVGATALGLALLHVLGIFLTYFYITAVQDHVWLFKYRKRYYPQ